jgi:hypothetical protein
MGYTDEAIENHSEQQRITRGDSKFGILACNLKTVMIYLACEWTWLQINQGDKIKLVRTNIAATEILAVMQAKKITNISSVFDGVRTMAMAARDLLNA